MDCRAKGLARYLQCEIRRLRQLPQMPQTDDAAALTRFPFTALVGQEPMKLALVLNAINPSIGGVLIRGEKGTAKSTAVRALARLLPDQDVVDGCDFGCHPEDRDTLCSDCRERLEDGENPLPRSRRRRRVVELPINASEDRVVGT